VNRFIWLEVKLIS